MSLMTAKIRRDGAEDGAITPRCGAELKLGSGDKASRGLGMRGMGLAFALPRSHFFKGGWALGFGANFRGGAVVVNDDLFTF